MSFYSRSQRFITRAIDLFMPPLCLACDTHTDKYGTLCPSCWKQTHFIAPPFCARCGVPFDTPASEGMLCGNCLTYPPVYSSARAALAYDDASKALILAFKHGDQTHMATPMAGWMHRADQELLADTQALIPIPLHRWRLLHRRYNQAAMLAKALGRHATKPVWPDALLRTKPTPKQGQMSRKEREANVKGAFATNPAYTDRIKDARVTLIDDVMTSGATANEAARTLLAAGASDVTILTLARVKNGV